MVRTQEQTMHNPSLHTTFVVQCSYGKFNLETSNNGVNTGKICCSSLTVHSQQEMVNIPQRVGPNEKTTLLQPESLPYIADPIKQFEEGRSTIYLCLVLCKLISNLGLFYTTLVSDYFLHHAPHRERVIVKFGLFSHCWF